MLNIRFDQLKERISELKNESFKIIHSEEQKEKRKQKSEERLRDLLNTINQNNKCIILVPQGEEREKGGKVYLKKYWLNFSQTWGSK